MEAGRSLLSSSPQLPPKTHLRNCSFPSVLMLHEQVTPSLTSLSTASLTRQSHTSVLSDEQHKESRSVWCLKENSAFEQTLDRRQLVIVSAPLSHGREGTDDDDPDQWPSLQRKEQTSRTKSESMLSKSKNSAGIEADRVVALAREAFSACKEAASIAKGAELLGAHLDDCLSIRTVRSTRLLERQSKKRRVPKPKAELLETNYRKKPEFRRKHYEGFNQNDPLRLFLRGPETTQLLTAKEESELIEKIQELMKLNGVKSQLQTQFSREPTVVEWAEAVGTSCHALQSRVHHGNRSRDRLIYANLRMVVHVAKQYQGRGLSLPDLLQEGSMGLMRSIQKFKPHIGCRFATYAYWWIRQSIIKATFQHSRTIRLPENVYGLLSKVYEAKKVCIQNGNHYPKNEDIAACAGISVDRLEALLYTARVPLSIQQPVWMDQSTTFQEITADTSIEVPELSVSKQLMRQHIRSLLSVLNPRERKIIRLRFGIENGNQKSLSEIGAGFGLSKERIRQLESRALYKLRQCLNSQGLEAYEDMLI